MNISSLIKKSLAAAVAGGVLVLAGSAYAATSNTINMSVQVLDTATVSGLDTPADFSNIDPADIEAGNVTQAYNTVEFYTNSATSNVTITATASNATGGQAEITNGTDNIKYTLTCTPCGTGSASLGVISPVTVNPATTVITHAEATPAACTAQVGNCTLQFGPTAALPPGGATPYTGNLQIAVAATA